MHELALLGRAAEEAVADVLRDRGYTVVEQNFQEKWGELDLVVRNRDEIVVVEVRSRRGGDDDDAADSVDEGKRHRVRRTTERYLDDRPIDYREVRFHVATVVWLGDDPRVTILEDAF